MARYRVTLPQPPNFDTWHLMLSILALHWIVDNVAADLNADQFAIDSDSNRNLPSIDGLKQFIAQNGIRGAQVEQVPDLK